MTLWCCCIAAAHHSDARLLLCISVLYIKHMKTHIFMVRIQGCMHKIISISAVRQNLHIFLCTHLCMRTINVCICGCLIYIPRRRATRGWYSRKISTHKGAKRRVPKTLVLQNKNDMGERKHFMRRSNFWIFFQNFCSKLVFFIQKIHFFRR